MIINEKRKMYNNTISAKQLPRHEMYQNNEATKENILEQSIEKTHIKSQVTSNYKEGQNLYHQSISALSHEDDKEVKIDQLSSERQKHILDIKTSTLRGPIDVSIAPGVQIFKPDKKR